MEKCEDISKCKVAMVLGSGLNGFADNLKDPAVIPYDEIPNWKTGSVKGHKSCLVIGALKTHPDCFVVIMQGRMHLYEGYSAYEVSFPVRVFSEIGIKNIILTCAAGALNPEYECSDIIIIKDHINMMGVNPLIGYPCSKNMFVDMSNCYD